MFRRKRRGIRPEEIQTHTFEDLAFPYLSGDQHRDHATIAEFCNRQLLVNLGEL